MNNKIKQLECDGLKDNVGKTTIDEIRDGEFEYVAIRCGYIDKLSINSIAKFATKINTKLVSIDAYTKNETKYDEVLFKCNKVSDIFVLTNHLIDCQHCLCFDWDTLYELTKQGNVVVLGFDPKTS